MQSKNRSYSPFWGILFREIRRFSKVLFQTVGTPLVSAILYFVIFGLSLGKNIQFEDYTSYLAFLIPGIMMMTALRNSFENSISTVIVSRYTNELQDFKIVPLSNSQILWGICLASTFRGLIIAVLTLLTGEILYFASEKTFVMLEHPFWLVYFTIFSLLAFSFMGFYASMRGKNFEQVNAISSFILLPLLYLGGIFFPTSSLHPFWQFISKFNPLLYIINGAQYGVLGISTISIAFSALWTLAFTLFFYALCQRVLKKGLRYHW